jgi:hypothetical protein
VAPESDTDYNQICFTFNHQEVHERIDMSEHERMTKVIEGLGISAKKSIHSIGSSSISSKSNSGS